MTESEEKSESRVERLQRELEKAFPVLWREDDHGRKTYPNVGVGWQQILWDCSAEITAEIDSVKQLYPVEDLPRVSQVKEKFGGLRFYTGSIVLPIADSIRDIILKYVNLSFETCEQCGESGKTRHHFPELPDIRFGWVKTLCESCWYSEAERRAQRGGATKEVRRWYYERRRELKRQKREEKKANG